MIYLWRKVLNIKTKNAIGSVIRDKKWLKRSCIIILTARSDKIKNIICKISKNSEIVSQYVPDGIR